jgi:hypothetical protein
MTGLAVAVTGPTGEIGISTVEALERDPAVDRIVGMARRPFDPAAHGWTKTTYQQGDILDAKLSTRWWPRSTSSSISRSSSWAHARKAREST